MFVDCIDCLLLRNSLIVRVCQPPRDFLNDTVEKLLISVPGQDCSSYSTIDSAFRGATYSNSTPSNCDNGLNNATWYRFTGQYQQIKLLDTCIDKYHCNAKQTYVLDDSSRTIVSDRHFTFSVQIGVVTTVGTNCYLATPFLVNVYECDTFLLYNMPSLGGKGSPAADCFQGPEFESAGFCLEDTVKPLILSTELPQHTFKLDSTTTPLILSANATRSPTPPLISWFGGGKSVTVKREGFIQKIFNMWSEISVPSNVEYRTVSYCVNTTCGTFNLYSVEMKGVVQNEKVAYITATVKSDISPVAISWKISIYNYNKSEDGVVVDNGILKDGVQVASLTLYKDVDYGLKDATISLQVNDSSTATTVNLEPIALCYKNYYFSKGSCEECPDHTVSPEGSVKSEDCQQCKANTYFNVNTCTECPPRHHSDAGSTKPEDCIKDKTFPLKELLIIGATCLVLIVIIILAVIIYKRRNTEKPASNHNTNNNKSQTAQSVL